MAATKELLEQLKKVRAPCTRSPFVTGALPPSREQAEAWLRSESLEGRTAK